MLFARLLRAAFNHRAASSEAEQRKDIPVFPLAIPLIAGPGALTTVLLMVSEQGDNPAVFGATLGGDTGGGPMHWGRCCFPAGCCA